MNKKRAILISIALYISTFIIGVVLALAGNVNFTTPGAIPTYYWVVSLITTVGLAGIASVWYFNSQKTRRNTKEGFLLGIMFIIMGFILDMVFFLPAVFTGTPFLTLLEYYAQPIFYFTLILVICTTTLIGSRGEPEKTPKSRKK